MTKALFPALAVLLLGVIAGPLLAARPMKGLSASDLGLGLPKKETPFEPGWSATAGAVFLSRSSTTPIALAESPPPESETLLSTSDIALGFETGPIVSLARQVNEITTAEILYFGIDGWGGNATALSPGGITTSRFDIGATLLDQVNASYDSQIHNVEVNVVRSLSARLRWLAGFRWTGLEESSRTIWDGRSTGTDFCSISAGATNNLYGMQLGLDATLWQPAARLHLDGNLKAAILANHMSSGRDVEGTLAAISSTARTVDRTSLLGECGLLGTFDLTERVSLSAGYRVLWLDGVATGFSPLGGPDVDSAFYHGLTLTVEANW